RESGLRLIGDVARCSLRLAQIGQTTVPFGLLLSAPRDPTMDHVATRVHAGRLVGASDGLAVGAASQRRAAASSIVAPCTGSPRAGRLAGAAGDRR
ncbi:MAG: hypothetical protein JSW31_05395, partial [Burkholderiales bacterium]